ncbi:tryptophan 2-C-methyltransferase [Saccharothrix texasensis]|uniref:Tryptophan 2-C-methyltransferase n=1 Tax=Saccharothrix texasensis TaxID=103734 RepID=A0A3N1GZI8_9PSEU|nr:tryptophan 2-C-methyltransferase [Saccharothrix texasensis]ROP35516.1 tryptophan 2-C-methyltransferase [Saccharothrix texasensis]
MGRALVTLVNPNKIRPTITPYALDILTTSLEESGFDVEVVDLNFHRDEWRAALAGYFDRRRPLLVGVTVRNTDTIYPQEQKVFVGEHREIITEIRRLTSAPLVVGGVGFSSMPFALVDYFGVDYGVKGPGELIICRLADALLTGGSPRDVPGLIVNEGGGAVTRVPVSAELPTSPLAHAGHGESRAWQANRGTAYTRRSGVEHKVDNLAHYHHGGLGNILTKNGCPFTCAHCVEPDAKGNGFARRTVTAVVDEVEALTAQGVHDLHTTDSEFNLSIANSKAVLREIARRKDTDASSPLHSLRLWIYSQPAPFDEEFADLLVAAGCRGVNVAPDHVREDLLNGWKVTAKGTRYYTFDDTVRVVELARERGMLTMVEVLLGMPGETLDTLRECIDRIMALDATVAGFTLGLRAFPYSPLGMDLARQCSGERTVRGLQSNTATEPIVLKTIDQCASVVEYERQFLFEPSGGFRPVYYFSPQLPEDEETLSRPDGRWLNTLRFMWEHIPERDYPRVMLPTAPGLSRHDNNYADNPFLTSMVQLGYRGAFWSRWRDRDSIIEEARAKGIVVPAGA